MEYTYYFCSLLYLDDIARGHDAAEFVLGRLAQQHGTRSLNRDIGHTLRLVAELRRNLNIDIARHEHTLDMPKLGLAHVKQATHGVLGADAVGDDAYRKLIFAAVHEHDAGRPARARVDDELWLIGTEYVDGEQVADDIAAHLRGKTRHEVGLSDGNRV